MENETNLKILQASTDGELEKKIENFKKKHDIESIKKATNVAFIFYYVGNKQLNMMDIAK